VDSSSYGGVGGLEVAAVGGGSDRSELWGIGDLTGATGGSQIWEDSQIIGGDAVGDCRSCLGNSLGKTVIVFGGEVEEEEEGWFGFSGRS
jgi:hypothetical protein